MNVYNILLTDHLHGKLLYIFLGIGSVYTSWKNVQEFEVRPLSEVCDMDLSSSTEVPAFAIIASHNRF